MQVLLYCYTHTQVTPTTLKLFAEEICKQKKVDITFGVHGGFLENPRAPSDTLKAKILGSQII